MSLELFAEAERPSTLWLRATKSRAAESKDDDLACASIRECHPNVPSAG